MSREHEPVIMTEEHGTADGLTADRADTRRDCEIFHTHEPSYPFFVKGYSLCLDIDNKRLIGCKSRGYRHDPLNNVEQVST